MGNEQIRKLVLPNNADTVPKEEVDSFEGVVLSDEAELNAFLEEECNVAGRKIFLKLLWDCLPAEDRRASCPTAIKDLKEWLKSPNSVRNYIFYSPQGLKKAMEKRDLVLLGGGRATAAKMIQALSVQTNADGSPIAEPSIWEGRNYTSIILRTFGWKYLQMSLGHYLIFVSRP